MLRRNIRKHTVSACLCQKKNIYIYREDKSEAKDMGYLQGISGKKMEKGAIENGVVGGGGRDSIFLYSSDS